MCSYYPVYNQQRPWSSNRVVLKVGKNAVPVWNSAVSSTQRYLVIRWLTLISCHLQSDALLVYIGLWTRQCVFPALWGRIRTIFQRKISTLLSVFYCEYYQLEYCYYIFAVDGANNGYLSSFFSYAVIRAMCKQCPKRMTTCAMGARQCTDCKSPEDCTVAPLLKKLEAIGTTTTERPRSRRPRRRLNKRKRNHTAAIVRAESWMVKGLLLWRANRYRERRRNGVGGKKTACEDCEFLFCPLNYWTGNDLFYLLLFCSS